VFVLELSGCASFSDVASGKQKQEMRHDTGKQVLITGATGAIGPSVAREFLAAGYAVRGLALNPPKPGILPDQVALMVGDISDPSTMASAIQGASMAIHIAALLHVLNPPEWMKARYKQVNVDGTATVVRAALDADVERLVFFSTIAVYGSSEGEILTEDSAPHPGSLYAQTKLDAERIVLDARRHDGQALGTVLRLAAVYGSRTGGNYRRLVQSLAHRRFVPVGDGSNRRTLIYCRDVARAALLVARHPAAAGRMYNVTDGRCHAVKEIIRTICGALGRRPPLVNLPIRPVRWAAGMLEDLARSTRLKSPIGRAMIDKYAEDLAVSGERIQNELGFVPEYDLVRGWKETISKMRQSGEL
jgi:UDP-glucose 4-epimerase